ncbi:hypothetical protein PIB30_093994, partial [Stylosanthes scabra]|nr:hypothetical protein [Stylosanthes scabra]
MEVVEMVEGGALDAGLKAVRGSRGSGEERVVEELEARRAEGGGVEMEGAGGAEAAMAKQRQR